MDANILTEILAIFLSVGEWISSAVTSLTPMFWTGSALTFIGTLAVAGLAFSVAFLVINIISNFLHFRG